MGAVSLLLSAILSIYDKNLLLKYNLRWYDVLSRFNIDSILYYSDGLLFRIPPSPGDVLTISLLHDGDGADIFAPQKDDVVIDVGAHLGGYAVRASKIVGLNGKVIAIEANPARCKLLSNTVQLNSLTNIDVFNLAASSNEGMLTLYDSGLTGSPLKKAAESFFVNFDTYDIPSTSIDSIVADSELSKIDWIKIDVDGGEKEVIMGMTKTLSISKNLVIEVIGVNLDFVLNTLSSNGFETITTLHMDASESWKINYDVFATKL